MSRLRVEGLTASYGPHRVLDAIDLEVETGQLLAVLGPSGCGKSTLLRCLAGLKPPDAGRVLLDGEDVTLHPPHRRGIALLHQEDALFPHLDVQGNVAFAPRLHRLPPPERRRRVEELLELVDLAGFERRRPDQLSGGQRQRVALARALAAQPRVLLLDEPLSHLDQPLRVILRAELREILRRAHATAVYVTHDREEAFALADSVALLESGRVVDRGAAPRVYEEPATPEAARLLGRRNLIPYERTSNGVRTGAGELPLPLGPGAPEAGVLLLREDELRVAPAGPGVPVRIVACEYLGGRYRIHCRWGSHDLWVEQAGLDGLRLGDEARLDVSRARPRAWTRTRAAQFL